MLFDFKPTLPVNLFGNRITFFRNNKLETINFFLISIHTTCHRFYLKGYLPALNLQPLIGIIGNTPFFYPTYLRFNLIKVNLTLSKINATISVATATSNTFIPQIK